MFKRFSVVITNSQTWVRWFRTAWLTQETLRVQLRALISTRHHGRQVQAPYYLTHWFLTYMRSCNQTRRRILLLRTGPYAIRCRFMAWKVCFASACRGRKIPNWFVNWSCSLQIRNQQTRSSSLFNKGVARPKCILHPHSQVENSRSVTYRLLRLYTKMVDGYEHYSSTCKSQTREFPTFAEQLQELSPNNGHWDDGLDFRNVWWKCQNSRSRRSNLW